VPQCERGFCPPPPVFTRERGNEEPRLFPFPRFNIGLMNGRPGDLADLKPRSVPSDADLRGENWWEVDLRGVTRVNVDLIEANLTGAHLRGVRFSEVGHKRANLRDTDLRGADLQGAEVIIYVRWKSDACRTIGADLAGTRYDRSTRRPARFDRQGHVSAFHEKPGQMITGANSKRQPELATVVDTPGGPPAAADPPIQRHADGPETDLARAVGTVSSPLGGRDQEILLVLELD
jgi:hypothetical protein